VAIETFGSEHALVVASNVTIASGAHARSAAVVLRAICRPIIGNTLPKRGLAGKKPSMARSPVRTDPACVARKRRGMAAQSDPVEVLHGALMWRSRTCTLSGFAQRS
jgi:hypothetical protein